MLNFVVQVFSRQLHASPTGTLDFRYQRTEFKNELEQQEWTWGLLKRIAIKISKESTDWRHLINLCFERNAYAEKVKKIKDWTCKHNEINQMPYNANAIKTFHIQLFMLLQNRVKLWFHVEQMTVVKNLRNSPSNTDSSIKREHSYSISY